MNSLKENLWGAIGDFVIDSIHCSEMSSTPRQERNRKESLAILTGLIDTLCGVDNNLADVKWQIDAGNIYGEDKDGKKCHEVEVKLAFGRKDETSKFLMAASLLVRMQPRGKLSAYEAELIRKMALELESTGRTSALSEGQEKADAIARNRQIQSGMCDLLDSLTLAEG